MQNSDFCSKQQHQPIVIFGVNCPGNNSTLQSSNSQADTTIIASNLQRHWIITLKIEPQSPRTPICRLDSILCQNLSASILKAATNRRPCESQWPTRLVRCSRIGPPPSHGVRPFPYRLPRRRRVASSSSSSVFEEEKKNNTHWHT